MTSQQAVVPFDVVHRSWAIDLRVDRAHLRFCRFNLKCAKTALSQANQRKCRDAKARAFVQLNQARTYLREACRDLKATLDRKPLPY